ncbi:energy transducer TonB [Alcaligenaceae bacterium]|nr:energy transducer TonB [Alcaligenaceae bacterium]
MTRSYGKPAVRSVAAIKFAGVVAAVSLHVAVLGMVFIAPAAEMVEPSMDEGTEIHFVELADVVDEVAQAPTEQVPDNVEEQPEPVIEPIIDPVPEPLAESDPVAEPETLPEPVVELEPEPLPEPEPEPEPEPVVVPKPQAKPTPKSKPKSQPKLQAKAAPVSQPSPKPTTAPVNTAPSAPPANTPAATSPSPIPDNKPRMVSRVDYLGKRPMPVYPRSSQRRQEQGRVVVRVLISAEGKVLDVQVRSSSGFDSLDQAAIKAARSARFKPYTENGIAYRAMADLPFDFVL